MLDSIIALFCMPHIKLTNRTRRVNRTASGLVPWRSCSSPQTMKPPVPPSWIYFRPSNWRPNRKSPRAYSNRYSILISSSICKNPIRLSSRNMHLSAKLYTQHASSHKYTCTHNHIRPSRKQNSLTHFSLVSFLRVIVFSDIYFGVDNVYECWMLRCALF